MPSPRILYCILNWGLGHATRSIPVIRALQAEGYEVEIASDGGPLTFLRKAFPECISHPLPEYDIKYPTKSVFLNIISQSYKILRAVRNEHRETQELVKKNRYDAIVSDNRYGCYDLSIPSMLITHQLSNAAKRSSIINKPGEWTLSQFFKNFEEIWIPDTPDRILSGKLTDTSLEKVRFIGHLSDQLYSHQKKEYEISAILSGPEPQRTKLEKEILPQLVAHRGKCVLVRGIMNDDQSFHEGDVTIYPYKDRAGINKLLNSSEVILCRTGYSSLMDLLNVGAKAILIPTPGQPEQIYLGERMKRNEQFVVQKQDEVNVSLAVKELQQRNHVSPVIANDLLLAKAIQLLNDRIDDKYAY